MRLPPRLIAKAFKGELTFNEAAFRELEAKATA